MSNPCKEYEEALMDIHYGEIQWSSSLEEHLKVCEGCSQFWQELQGMKEILNEPNDVPIDYGSIKNVMETAESIKTRKENIRDLALFVLLASSILGVIANLLIHGYGKQVLYLQGILHVGLPLALPLILWRRRYKEGYNE